MLEEDGVALENEKPGRGIAREIVGERMARAGVAVAEYDLLLGASGEGRAARATVWPGTISSKWLSEPTRKRSSRQCPGTPTG